MFKNKIIVFMIATIMLSTAFTSVVNASINYDTPDSKYFP